MNNMTGEQQCPNKHPPLTNLQLYGKTITRQQDSAKEAQV